MGSPAARQNDIGVGICCCHHHPDCINMTGMIITASGDSFNNGMGHARLTDLMLGFCGHLGIIVSAAATVRTNGLGRARIGDLFTGCFTGNIVTGSPDTFIGA